MDGTFKLEISIDDDSLLTELGYLEDRIKDLSPAFENVAIYLQEAFEKQFESEGQFMLNSRWEPLKKPRPGGGILTKSGDMRASFSRGSPGHYEVITESEMSFGSVLPTPGGEYVLARLHQSGTKNMPSRKIFQWSREVAEAVVGLIKKYTMESPTGRGNAMMNNEFQQTIGE